MLLAEKKDSAADIAEELEAFNPLVPSSEKELIFTLMFEIDNPLIRERTLKQLAGVEAQMQLSLNENVHIFSENIKGEEDLYKVNKEGKTSAVHFRKFVLPENSLDVKSASISCLHENYGHSTTLSPTMIDELFHFNKKD
jgi:hypothetical protein